MWETRRVFQALREQSGMSTPLHTALWMIGRWLPPVQQIGQQDGIVTGRAPTAHAQCSAEQLARGAAALANKPLLATRALVDGVRRQDPLALELLADHRLSRDDRLLLAHPKSALFAGRRAERCPSVRQYRIAHWAGAGTQAIL